MRRSVPKLRANKNSSISLYGRNFAERSFLSSTPSPSGLILLEKPYACISVEIRELSHVSENIAHNNQDFLTLLWYCSTLLIGQLRAWLRLAHVLLRSRRADLPGRIGVSDGVNSDAKELIVDEVSTVEEKEFVVDEVFMVGIAARLRTQSDQQSRIGVSKLCLLSCCSEQFLCVVKAACAILIKGSDAVKICSIHIQPYDICAEIALP
jgi:hypothetical protein